MEPSSACLLLLLPEDVFGVISRCLTPSDICNLSLTCKSLCDLVDTEKVWFVQCEVVNVLSLSEIVQWRVGVGSYKSLCRFLVEVVKPLVGVWVAQNPELGNVVYVMPGFLSVVGCRVIPQEVGSSGVLWSPVFEIVCGFDGSISFFLHGRDGEGSCLYPGFVTGIEKSCNVLLLEVEPRGEIKIESEVSFRKLAFSDRRKLLDLVTSRVGLPVNELLSGKLFDKARLLERRTMLLKMCSIPIQVDVNEVWTNLGYDDENQKHVTEKKSFSKYIRSLILGKSSKASSSSEIKRLNFQRFLSSGDWVALNIKASKKRFSSYQGWPNMNETHFALYKLPIKNHVDSHKYAGLWGGTFGWPCDDKPGKALFLLMLTYDDSEKLLIGTKILEGTHYVMHPNGSAMFVVNIESPSFEVFPFDTNGEDFEESYAGEGIVKGYGFRYPGYKPGSLFVTSSGLLMFVWKEIRVVLTLQRLNLEELLKKGLFVPPLLPSLNFTYLTKSHTNVFASGRKNPLEV